MRMPIQVLVIDDDPSDRFLFSTMLSAQPDEFVVTCASGLKDPLFTKAPEKFDVVLLDLMLGPTAGLETLRAFVEITTKVPLIVLSGVAGEDVALEAVEAGAQDYLAKDSADFALTSRSIKYAIQRHELKQQLKFQAESDPVTGLANRAGFAEALESAMERTVNEKGRQFAIAFIDIDDFKMVNDIHGHATGDRLLVQFASRLERCVRKSDVIGRFGGDEFVVILDDVNSNEDVGKFVNRFEGELAQPFVIDGRNYDVSASMGLVIHEPKYQTSDEMLRDADIAMYRAKDDGKSGHRWFRPEMRDNAVAKFGIGTQLKNAIGNNEFEVFYQPMVNLQTGQLIRFEALARWIHPVRGLISPLQFIPLAETSGMIIPIGKWVLETACRQTQEWREQFGVDLGVSINVSPIQLSNHHFCADVFSAVDSTGIPIDRLDLEVTETSIMKNPTSALAMLRELSSSGIRIGIDDFGTGFASLSQLNEFEYDTLKIDRSFIQAMLSEGDAFVRAIVSVAESLNLEIVAEGIEHENQADHLKLLNCHTGQGFLFGKPMPVSNVKRLLQSGVYTAEPIAELEVAR